MAGGDREVEVVVIDERRGKFPWIFRSFVPGSLIRVIAPLEWRSIITIWVSTLREDRENDLTREIEQRNK